MNIFNLLAAVVTPIVVPYFVHGGIYITAIPTLGLVTLFLFLLAIIVLTDIAVIWFQVSECREDNNDTLMKMLFALIDVMVLAANVACGIIFYCIIDVIISRF